MDELVKANQRALDLQYQLTDAEEELDRLRKIAACFRDGDAAILSVARGLLRGCGVMKDSPMMNTMDRVQAAAKLAEETC